MTAIPTALDDTGVERPLPPLSRRVVGQGALLFAGFAAAQGFGFLRNAVIGYSLSMGDFGIAATITLILQLTEMLTDIGSDRLVVQAPDGDTPAFLATAHTCNIVRGVLTAAVLYLAASPVAAFFAIPHVQWALELAALAPLVRGLMHLDGRRAQRRLDNRPQILVEVLPQAAAFAATLPLVVFHGGYAIAMWLALLQAVLAVALSHAIATVPYRLAVDTTLLRRFIAFGWPIWLSAFPLMLVLQGDRIVIARLLGMDELAAYSAAFSITMIPSLVAARVGQSLMLPVLSAALADATTFERRFARLVEATAVTASLYLVLFVGAGGAILPLAFGPNYAGFGAVVGWLAVMWSIRMTQAVPGMALMALGETRPFLVAGLIRASAIVLSLAAAVSGWGLPAIAAAGVLGELGSLAYLAWRLGRQRPALTRLFLTGSVPVLLAMLAGAAAAALFPPQLGVVAPIAAAALIGAMLVQLSSWSAPDLHRALHAARANGGLTGRSI